MANDDPDGGLEAPSGNVLDVDEDEIIEVKLPATVHERFATAPCKALHHGRYRVTEYVNQPAAQKVPRLVGTHQEGLHLNGDDVRQLRAGMGDSTSTNVSVNVHLTAVLVMARELVSHVEWQMSVLGFRRSAKRLTQKTMASFCRTSELELIGQAP